MLTKQERKSRFKAVQEERMSLFQKFHVFGNIDMKLDDWVSALKRESRQFNLNLKFEIKDGTDIRIYTPGFPADMACFLQLEHAVAELVASFDGYDHANDTHDRLLQLHCVTLSGQRELNPVINLIFNASTRFLGRISKGILVDVEEKYVSTDWLAWSCDYMEDDLFKAYGYEALAKRYPGLMKKRWWQLF
ncbi:hypothetical protein IGB42_03379 [Andreprevotia sp. IGB-42]|uniref:hypothetical protein n=1 Tax=Andreprevotia sp. IGB-42 TaxID=2497473 RepID=UPI00135A8DCB|nr:hypothetical protein [Andreprevotia sp. IGB-42]KAF0812102.1 hypothetical protein IGB42_03379 [Andreprevotia sp. IGB-42]